jgi:glycosyltransferase involved in cell wall biosynthesis
VENAPAYLKYFDLLFLTSDWEGMPAVIWEAMANGVPILSSDVGGVKEILESVYCGLVYDKDDIPTIVNIMKGIINETEKLKTMGNNGKLAIEGKYTLQNFSNTIDDFYTSLIEN